MQSRITLLYWVRYLSREIRDTFRHKGVMFASRGRARIDPFGGSILALAQRLTQPGIGSQSVQTFVYPPFATWPSHGTNLDLSWRGSLWPVASTYVVK